MKDASENLQDRNSQLCRCNPDRSAKLKLHLSKEAFVNADRLESALVKVELVEPGAAKTAFDRTDVVEIAALE